MILKSSEKATSMKLFYLTIFITSCLLFSPVSFSEAEIEAETKPPIEPASSSEAEIGAGAKLPTEIDICNKIVLEENPDFSVDKRKNYILFCILKRGLTSTEQIILYLQMKSLRPKNLKTKVGVALNNNADANIILEMAVNNAILSTHMHDFKLLDLSMELREEMAKMAIDKDAKFSEIRIYLFNEDSDLYDEIGFTNNDKLISRKLADLMLEDPDNSLDPKLVLQYIHPDDMLFPDKLAELMYENPTDLPIANLIFNSVLRYIWHDNIDTIKKMSYCGTAGVTVALIVKYILLPFIRVYYQTETRSLKNELF